MEDQQKSESDMTAGVRYSRYAYVILTIIIFAACVMAQVFLAGAAIFGNPEYWKMHTTFIHFFEFVPIIIFVLAFAGQLKGNLRWMPLGLMVLILVQYATANMADLASGFIAAVHPVTGMILFMIAMILVRDSWAMMFASNPKRA